MEEAVSAKVLSYEEVLAQLDKEKANVLLGNGFSIACDPVFNYTSLYDSAIALGLSKEAQSLFDYLDTRNFEAVMRLLDDAHYAAALFEVIADENRVFIDDRDKLKQVLINAISKNHLPNAKAVDDFKKSAAVGFLSSFRFIFTTNYDLLLYWVHMHGLKKTHEDGFRRHNDGPLRFREEVGGKSTSVFYLHGALHLYQKDGVVLKHSNQDKPLTELIRAAMDQRKYPLFVAEGSDAQKMRQIRANYYLNFCFRRFRRIKGDLVVLGHRLGVSDNHITAAIYNNRALERVFLGLHGPADDSRNLAIQVVGSTLKEKSDGRIEIIYFDSGSAEIWNASPF